jgi:ATP synthase protein I
LIAGLLLYTGLGWLVSRWVGHQALLMTIGAMVGLGLGYYLLFTSLAHEQREDDKRQANRVRDRQIKDMEDLGVVE